MTTGLPPQPTAAASAAADGPVRWSATTGTRIDTGRWFRRSPVAAQVVGDRFVLTADGPRPFRRVLPISALRRAVYNHVTGELAFPARPSATAAAQQADATTDIPGLLLDSLAARDLLDLVAAAP